METVKIRLRKPTRVFTFLSENIALEREDDCIVRSDRGLEWGTCVVPPEPCPDHMKDRYKMNVVRRVNHNDESTYRQIQEEEARAKTLCAQRIRDHNLPMKLVDVEYTFDKHKVIFYFTAADRVDFRQLVRDLAQDLKTRIELRHIQVRDEAKLTGGIGMCGRELCCSTWLREFKPISMKMAKRQNLSLNPSKISGQCGRLLCCLSYENEMYKERRRTELAERDVPKPEPEPVGYVQDAFGAAGAFPESEDRPRPADWRERLDEMKENGDDVVLDDDGPAAESPSSAPRRPPRPQPSRTPQAQGQQATAAPAQPSEGGKRRGRSRRRRRRPGGSGSSGSAGSGGGQSSS
jgi:cell fate regulator YaaT (PSP1 superfamily)